MLSDMTLVKSSIEPNKTPHPVPVADNDRTTKDNYSKETHGPSEITIWNYCPQRFGKNYRMDFKDGQETQNCAWKIKGREASSLVA